MSDSKTRVLEAEEFRLVDDKGRLWGLMHAPRGSPAIDLRDEARRTYIRIEIQDGRPCINISRDGIEALVALGISSDGDVKLSVSGSDGKLRFMLSVNQGGDAELMLADKSGDNVKWRAP